MENYLSKIAQSIGRGVSAIGSLGLSEIALADRLKEEEKLKSLGGILAGSQIPAFAFKEQTPEQIQQAKTLQLAQLGTPEAVDLIGQMVDTPEKALERKLREEQIATEGLQRQNIQSQIGARNQALELRKQKEARLQDRQARIGDILNSLSYGYVPPADVSNKEELRGQLQTLQNRRKQISGLLLDPELKDFAKAEMSALDEEVKNIRQLEKEQRKLKEGKSPGDAAKISMVKKGIKDVDKAAEILMDKEGNFKENVVGSMVSVGLPFTDTKLINGIPFTEGRRARSLILNAVNAQLRAESGAAVPEQEVERAAQRFIPNLFDNEETKKTKLNSLRELLSGTIKETALPPEEKINLGLKAEKNITEKAMQKLQNTGRTQDGKPIFKYTPKQPLSFSQ